MSKKLFTCVECGEVFESMPFPAETRTDDPSPTCNTCLEAQLDNIDAVPITADDIARMLQEVQCDHSTLVYREDGPTLVEYCAECGMREPSLITASLPAEVFEVENNNYASAKMDEAMYRRRLGDT